MSVLRRALPYVFIAPALAISGYLLYRTLVLASKADIGLNICSVWLGVDCDATLTSDFAWPLGVPIAGWGIVYFIMLGAAVALGRGMGEPLEHVAVAAAVAIGTAGLAVSAWLSGMMVLGAVRICPLCFTVHALNLCAIAAVLASGNERVSQLPALLMRAAHTVFVGDGEKGDSKWALLGMACVGLITLVAYQWILVQSNRAQAMSQTTLDQLHAGGSEHAFARGLPVTIPIDDSDPQIGPADAPVQIVVFSSFQCPGCVSVAPILEEAAEHFEGQVRLTYKHYPLGADCNPSLDGFDMHPRACASAWAAQAAHEQGAFWAYHEAVNALKTPPEDAELRAVAQALDLDASAFAAAFDSEAVREAIAEDVRHGDALQLEGTPTVYVNGRELIGVDRDILFSVIADQLGDSAHAGHAHD